VIESLVITLREGVEAALVVGIILAYLYKSGRQALTRWVYWGLGLAIAASLVLAGTLQALDVSAENERVEGTMFIIGGAMVATLVIWIWRTSRNIKGNLESRVSALAGQGKGGLGLFVFTFFMVFREGAETVLFLLAATLGEFSMGTIIGGGLGIALAVVFALLIFKGSLRVNLSRFFAVTSVVLIVLAVKLVLGGLHEFAEVGAIPMSKNMMAFIGYFVRDDASMAILMALLALPLLAILWDARTPADKAPEATSDVQKRLARSARSRERTWRIALVVVALFIMAALVSTVFASSSFYDPEPIPVAAQPEAVAIAISSMETDKLYKYSYTVDGVDVRFIAARLEDGTIQAGLDACQICGALGYMQEGEEAICKNCNAPIDMHTLGLGGGCNPLPVQYTADGGMLTIPVSALRAAAVHFQ